MPDDNLFPCAVGDGADVLTDIAEMHILFGKQLPRAVTK